MPEQQHRLPPSRGGAAPHGPLATTAARAATRPCARRSHELDRDEAVYQFVRSGLRGRGGAGFPMGRKASFIPKDSALPAYVVCNADESEPGTFKDREMMEDNPFQLLEGITIAGYAIGAARGYIYIRGEYEHQARVLESAIAQARAAGLLGTGRDWARRSTSTSRSTAARAPTSAARRRRCSRASRASAASRG